MGDFDAFDDQIERHRFKIPTKEDVQKCSREFKNDDDYKKYEALNFSTLKLFLNDLRFFKSRKEKESESMKTGTIFHKKILQPDVFKQSCQIFNPPINSKTGKPFLPQSNAYQEEINKLISKDIIPITNDLENRISNVELALMEYGLANDFCCNAVNEISLASEIDGILVKGKIDCYNDKNGIIDLKTTEQNIFSNGYNKVKRLVLDSMYDKQLAFYAMIVEKLTGYLVPCKIIFVETMEPYRCATCNISPETIENNIRYIKEDYIPLWKRYKEGESLIDNYDITI